MDKSLLEIPQHVLSVKGELLFDAGNQELICQVMRLSVIDDIPVMLENRARRMGGDMGRGVAPRKLQGHPFMQQLFL